MKVVKRVGCKVGRAERRFSVGIIGRQAMRSGMPDVLFGILRASLVFVDFRFWNKGHRAVCEGWYGDMMMQVSPTIRWN